MDSCFQVFICGVLVTGIQSASQIPWLPCHFIDEEVTYNTKGHVETKHIPRKAILQFGQKGETLVNPLIVTFLITPSKLDVRQFLVGAKPSELSCKVERYSTDGSHVRWPVRGEHEYNRWYSLTIDHSQKLVSIVAFIRQSTDQPPTGQNDYKSWTVIQDRDVLTTSVVMVLQTKTPEVKSQLQSLPKLHCQFDIDHKAPKVTVRWHKVGHRSDLFNHSSQTGLTRGSGVSLEQMAEGDATYTYPLTKVGSEGEYVCSVNVHPLLGSLKVNLHIEEPPRVSLNVDSTLTLYEGALKRVECRAESYYPLDVDIQWSQQGSTDMGPRVDSAQLSSHSQNIDQTFSLYAFFYILPKLTESGRKFTCSISHSSLPVPIRKTFTLIVIEPGQWILVFNVICLLVVLVLMLRFCLRVRRRRFY